MCKSKEILLFILELNLKNKHWFQLLKTGLSLKCSHVDTRYFIEFLNENWIGAHVLDNGSCQGIVTVIRLGSGAQRVHSIKGLNDVGLL
jgi:hypothetical protein